MERRAFVKGAFGFVALATLGIAGAAVGANASHPNFVTAPISDVEPARGPAMAAGIELVENGNVVHGMYGNTHLFNVDANAGGQLKPADVASFFVELGQAGYLANTVLVNLTETQA